MVDNIHVGVGDLLPMFRFFFFRSVTACVRVLVYTWCCCCVIANRSLFRAVIVCVCQSFGILAPSLSSAGVPPQR